MSNKVVLVTGGSRGIGKAIALAFAKEGYDIIINYQGNKLKAEETVMECIALGSAAVSIGADVTNVDQVVGMMEQVVSEFGRIDILVNNSGITKDNLVLRMTEESFHEVIDVNLNGSFHMIKQVSRYMLKQRSGSIINIASVIGLVGNVGQANYAASKAGLIGLTKSCAKEFASRGVRVNAIAPGFIQTEMTEQLNEKIKESILSNIPLRQFGNSEDVANLAIFLASDNSQYITGQVINVDGGMVM